MTESQHQRNVIKWSQQPHIRSQYPMLKYLHHIKNETTGGAAQVAIDRAMGVKKGVPDLFLPFPVGGLHGLYIEMKAEKGRASEEQRWWVNELNQLGYRALICHGWECAVLEIMRYLNGEV